MIVKFKKQHMEACTENWVCKRLRLHNIEFTGSSSGASEPPSPPQVNKKARANKHNIEYILSD